MRNINKFMDRQMSDSEGPEDSQGNNDNDDDRGSNAESNMDQEVIDYEDIFEEARREEVLRQINQGDLESENSSDSQIESQREHHEEVDAILERKAKRQSRKEEINNKNEMKKLRHRNALQFFRKIKTQLLLSFRESILQAKSAILSCEQKLQLLFSYCDLETLRLIHSLKVKLRENIKRRDFVQIVEKVFGCGSTNLKDEAKYKAIWSLAIYLGIGFRKLSFVDISHIQLQSFYNLKYGGTKGKKKGMKQMDIIKSILRRKTDEVLLQDKNFISIEQYSFDPKAFVRTSQIDKKMVQPEFSGQNQKKQSESNLANGEVINEMRKKIKYCYCQIFCPGDNSWQLFNMELLKFQEIQQVKTVLDNMPIIGFYSTRVMKFEKKYQELRQNRILREIELRDQTVDFCDKYQLVMRRRSRLGCRNLYNTILREVNKSKCFEVFSSFDKLLIEIENNKQREWAIANFPKSAKHLKVSDYFVTPSLVEKYMIIKDGAEPIPNLEFHGEKVYKKSDMQRVSSRMGWIDNNRMVKQKQIPIKTTENRNKTTTKLYRYNQTETFKIRLGPEGDLVLDQEYNSVYVPPSFEMPEGFVLIPDNVEYLCKKNKYKYARIVQGFDVVGSHVVPNNIGVLVEECHKSQIEKLFKERQQKMKEKKEEKKLETALTMWKKLFKSIIITQQVRNQ